MLRGDGDVLDRVAVLAVSDGAHVLMPFCRTVFRAFRGRRACGVLKGSGSGAGSCSKSPPEMITSTQVVRPGARKCAVDGLVVSDLRVERPIAGLGCVEWIARHMRVVENRRVVVGLAPGSVI